MSVRPSEHSTRQSPGSTGMKRMRKSPPSVESQNPSTRVGALPVRWPSDVRSFQKIGDRLVSLKTDGHAYELRELTQEWKPLAGFEERALEQIATAPLYDAFEVTRQ